MFGSGKKSAPTLCAGNTGIGVEGTIAFTNAETKWTEHFNTINLAAAVLQEQGYPVECEKRWLTHPASGFTLLPQLVSFKPLDKGGIQTTTTIQINHPVLVREGVFEYQHSTGDSTEDSISKGFEQWTRTDLLPLLDALEPEPKNCTSLKMSIRAKDGNAARIRRAVLGPVAHFMEKPPAKAVEGDEHPFCPCCMLTRSFDVFKELFEGEGFCALRFFAARLPDGTAQADCRLNGIDWMKGSEALREYAKTWPPAGYEFRKQYVVLQTVTE